MTRFLALNARLKADPTHTRKVWSSMADRAESALRRLGQTIGDRIIRENTFGIIPDRPAVNYEFKHEQDHLDRFMQWLQREEDKGILEIVERADAPRTLGRSAGVVFPAPWTSVYVDTAYQKGIRTADVKIQALGIEGFTSASAYPGGMKALFNSPVHADRLASVYSRPFEELKTVTREMNDAIQARLAEELRSGVAQGLAEGKNPNVIASEMVKDVDAIISRIGINRARMIARTETLRANHEANVSEYQRAERDLDGYHLLADWLLGAFPCDLCIENYEGSPYTIEEIDSMIPAHPYCVTGDTLLASDGIRAAMRIPYYGQIVELSFSDGRRLSVTPNHVLLSPSGWVPAGSLKSGDQILGYARWNQLVGSRDPNDHWGPAEANEIFRALSESSSMPPCRVPVSAEDLHGDGLFAEGEIDIVRTDRLLWRDLESAKAQLLCKRQFGWDANPGALSGRSDLGPMLRALSSAADGGVSRCGVLGPLLRGKIIGHKSLGLASGAQLHAGFSQATVDDGPGNTVHLREALDRFPGLVQILHVTRINRSVLRGHVFDLHSPSTMYIANGVLSSNCVCTSVPVLVANDEDDPTGPSTPAP
jgi:hypothetical protein